MRKPHGQNLFKNSTNYYKLIDFNCIVIKTKIAFNITTTEKIFVNKSQFE